MRMQRSHRRGERNVQRVNNSWLGLADPGDGVDRAHAGCQQAVIVVAVAGPMPDFELGVKARLAVDDDAPDAVGSAGSALRPIGGEVVGDAVDVLDGDDVDTVDDADATGPGGTDGSGFDKPERGGISRGVGRNSHVSRMSSSVTPSASATMVTAAPQPQRSTPGIFNPPR